MHKLIVYGVFLNAMMCQVVHRVKVRCSDLPESAGNCTESFFALSQCAILDENDKVCGEKKCDCSYQKLGNIFLPKECIWKDVPSNETVYLKESCSSDEVANAEISCDHESCEFQCHDGYAIEASTVISKKCSFGKVDFDASCKSIAEICEFPDSITDVKKIDSTGEILGGQSGNLKCSDGHTLNHFGDKSRYFSCTCKLVNQTYSCNKNYQEIDLYDKCVENNKGVEYPFFNPPNQNSLEGMLLVKNSKFSGFLSALYKTFLYGDEQYDIEVVESKDQLSHLEKHWLEKRTERYNARQLAKETQF